MKNAFLIILISIHSFSLFGSDPSENSVSESGFHPGSILITGTKGPESFKSLALDTTIGLSSKWSINGSFFQSDSGVATLLNEKLTSKEQRLGADWKIDQIWGTTFGVIARQDPYEITGLGAYSSLRTDINRWWDGVKSTTLTLKIEYLKITQDLQFQGKFFTLQVNKFLKQKNAYLLINQEIQDWLFILISHNRYTYTEESSSLGLTSASKRSSFAGEALSYGYPESSSKLELTYIPKDWLELRFSGSSTNILGSDSKTKTVALGTSFFIEQFQLDLEFSKTDYGSSSGIQESKQNYTSIGLGYNW